MSYIKLKYGKNEYKLGFSKATVRKMERNGFRIENVADAPTAYFPDLFYGAFLKYQPRMKQEDTNRILGNIKGIEGLTGKLVDLYNEPGAAMFEDPEEGSPNVATWEEVKE